MASGRRLCLAATHPSEHQSLASVIGSPPTNTPTLLPRSPLAQQFYTRTKTVTASWKDAEVAGAIPGLAGVGTGLTGHHKK